MAAATRSRSGRKRASTRARARKRTPRRRRSDGGLDADALRMLAEDHRRVRALFDRYERTRGAEKQRLAQRICDELKLHARLEEQVFYPAAREGIDDPELVKEAEVEHAAAKQLIAWIEASSPADAHFDAMVKVLGAYVLQHVRREEGELFPRVRRSRLDGAALGELMQSRKLTLMARMPLEERTPA